MKKSCTYCGRIHDSKYICEPKKAYQIKRWNSSKDSESAKFRSSYAWTNKSKHIRQLDNHMCLCCLNELQGTVKKYNTQHLQVHHIIPVEEDYSLRLEDNNLITVCERHHELCENGKISRSQQQSLITKRIKDCALVF